MQDEMFTVEDQTDEQDYQFLQEQLFACDTLNPRVSMQVVLGGVECYAGRC